MPEVVETTHAHHKHHVTPRDLSLPFPLLLLSQYDNATPLHHAAEEGDDLAITALISMGADVNEADSEGQTPLMTAASWCAHLVIVRARALLA
jgi:hypothetical protein